MEISDIYKQTRQVQVKFPVKGPVVAWRVGRGIVLLFHACDNRRGRVVSSMPRPHFTPSGKTQFSLYRRLGGPQDRSGRVENLAPPELDPWTVQPVAQSL